MSGEPGSVTAFHGSPHDFERFDIGKIGTGEGNQAYGRGLYFAQAEDVARGYQKTLSGNDFAYYVNGERVATERTIRQDSPRERAVMLIGSDPNGYDGAVASVKRSLESPRMTLGARSMSERILAEMQGLKGAQVARRQESAGRLYHVRIEADPAKMLDWDKRVPDGSNLRTLLKDYASLFMGSQNPAQRNAARDAVARADKPELTGHGVYQTLVEVLGGDHAAAAKALRDDAGIPGVKYLDRASRGVGDGTFNYVVFDDSLIRIVGKDGKAVPLNEYMRGQAQAKFTETVQAKAISPDLKADLTPPNVSTEGRAIVRAAMESDPKTVGELEAAVAKVVMDAAPEGMRPTQGTLDAFNAAVRSAATGTRAGGKPLSLLQYIAKSGGLALDGEAKARNLDKIFIPGGGPLARKNGKSIDGFWREALMEAGYLPTEADGYMSRDITDELYKLIDRERSGNKVYSSHDAQEVGKAADGVKPDGMSAEVAHAEEQIKAEHEAAGIDPKTLDVAALNDAAVALAKGHETDPGRAYERAIMDLAGRDDRRSRMSADAEDLVFRRRGAQPVQALPPDQVQKGRPLEAPGAAIGTPSRIARLEDVSRDLVKGFETIARTGMVTPGARGQFNTASGVIRVRSVVDLDTVAHEVGHQFHLHAAKRDVDALIRANAGELTALGAGDPKGNKEAFAELFRLYAVNPAYSAREFPASTLALDTLLRDKFPEQHRAIEAVRGQLDAIYRAPSQELVALDTLSGMPPNFEGVRKALETSRGPDGRTFYSPADALYTATIDRAHPVWRAVENLKAVAKDNGKRIDILPADDPYILLRLASGSNGTAGTILERGVIAAGDTMPSGPSLASAMRKALGDGWSLDKEGFRDFGAYLAARRMVAEYSRFLKGEIPNPPGKYSLADYQSAVAALDRKYTDPGAGRSRFAEAADELYTFQRNYLKRVFDAGLYSKAYYDAALTRADYVPFVRDMADFAADTPIGGKRPSSSLRWSVMKRFSGSQRAVQNPIESIFKRVHDLEFVIARNDAVNAMARLIDEAGPGAGAIGEHVPSNQLTAQKVDVIEALRQAGKTANVDPDDLKALILQAEDLLQDSTVATLFRQAPASEKGEPIIYRWVDGERRAIRLADGRFGREMYHAFTSLNAVESNILLKTLQLAQIGLRLGVTRSPAFIPVNIIRDQWTAAGTAGRNYIPVISAINGGLKVLRETPEAIAYAGRGGIAGGAVTETIDAGMFGKNVLALDHAGIGKVAASGDVWGAVKRFGKAYVKTVELSEAATRIGLYETYFRQAMAMGLDERNAVTFAAFKATDYIDFRKAGSAMEWNRRIFPFMNASLQGTDREARALLDLPVLEYKRATGEPLTKSELDRLKDARVSLVRVMALGLVVGGGLAVLNHDKPEWQSAQPYLRNNYWLMKVGDTWISAPKAYGLTQLVINLFERSFEYGFRKDPTIWRDYLASIPDAILPGFNNPLVSTYYDVTANFDRFRDRPIIPPYLQGVKPSEQATPGTSDFAKAVGRWTGWSPLKVDYVLRNMGGSSASELLRVADMAMGRDRPERQVYDWPVVNRFAKNLARGSAALTKFYDLVGEKNGEYTQEESAYRFKIRQGERTAAAEYLRDLKPDVKTWVTLQALGFDASEKRLHPMQNARDHVGAINGLVSQLNTNNVVREEDLDRRDMTRSRRDAQPIAVDASTRAKAVEALQELALATARNAMIAVEAKGTTGLALMDTAPLVARVKAISPAIYDEYVARREAKKVYDAAYTFKVWPELRARVVRDGETADLRDLLPAGVKRPKRRRQSETVE